MSYGNLFDGKAWEIRQQWVCHLLVGSDPWEAMIREMSFLLYSTTFPDHTKCGRAILREKLV
jgi:hypothetical protein